MIPALWLILATLTAQTPAPAQNTGQRQASDPTAVTVPVSVNVEGGTLPSPANSPAPTVRLTPTGDSRILEIPLSDKGIRIPVSDSRLEEYRVSIQNLPEGYVVKSITFRSTDLMTETLKASIENLWPRFKIVTYTGEGALQKLVDEITARNDSLSITLAPRQPEK